VNCHIPSRRDFFCGCGHITKSRLTGGAVCLFVNKK